MVPIATAGDAGRCASAHVPARNARASRGKLMPAGRDEPPDAARAGAARGDAQRTSGEAMNDAAAGDTVHILYGTSGMQIRLPPDARADGDRQAADGQAARSARGRARRAGAAGRRRAVRDAGARPQERLHPDLRHHAAGPQSPVPAAADRGHARGRHAARAHHRAGRDRPAPAERGRRSWPRSSAIRGCSSTVRVENHFARDDAAHVDLGVTPHAAHAGQARPPLRRGRPAHRHRPRRAALHGRLLGRPQGDRAGRRARGHDPHVPQRALHGGPGGDPVQPRRQPAARGAARDRADAGRGLRRQHRDRRGPRSRPRQFRRGHREPPRRGRLRRRQRRACRSAGASRRS